MKCNSKAMKDFMSVLLKKMPINCRVHNSNICSASLLYVKDDSLYNKDV